MQSWAWRNAGDTTTPLDALIRLLNSRLSKLADVVQTIIASVQTVQSFANGAAQPSVYGGNVWKAANTAPTSITAFKDGAGGQEIVIWATTANTTIVNSATLRTKSGANIVLTATEVRKFVTSDGVEWREV